MAQNDVINEIIFIADEQREAPSIAWKIPLAYLVALVLAEVLTAFLLPAGGMILYGLILAALLVHSSRAVSGQERSFLVILALVPLTRLVALTLPPGYIDPIYWYLLIGVLLSIAVVICARLAGYSRPEIGLRISAGELPLQLLIGLSGLGIGLVEYLILRPEPYLQSFNWSRFLLAALILLVFSGLLGEVIFRGLLQTASLQLLGRWGILYSALVFALLGLGYRSLLNFGFVFLVALGFGVIAASTRSLVGVSFAHGLASMGLFLVFPLLFASTAARSQPPLVLSVDVISTPTRLVEISPSPTDIPLATEPLVLIPVTGPTATSTPVPPTDAPLACGSHPNWVIYFVQSGETLDSISAAYGISPQELNSANCLEESHQVQTGEVLFVPFDLVQSPTPTLQVIFASLNTPTATATRKPTRKAPTTQASSTPTPVTPVVPSPTATSIPPSPTARDLPTLAPTQKPPPPPALSPTPGD
jgi:membrane protease YdiL (CAAX protease family)/LysM repeat protein